jgi:hypothetical protein
MSRLISLKIHVRLINYTKNHKVDTNIEYSNIIFSAGHSMFVVNERKFINEIGIICPGKS